MSSPPFTNKCTCPGCDNDARYVLITGAIVCGLCPIKLELDSFKLTDIGELLQHCRALVESNPLPMNRSINKMKEILGRKP